MTTMIGIVLFRARLSVLCSLEHPVLSYCVKTFAAACTAERHTWRWSVQHQQQLQRALRHLMTLCCSELLEARSVASMHYYCYN
jgi:hypothetical protein